MEGVLKYLMANYHILGVLLIVIIIAVKLFMTTKQAKKMLLESKQKSKTDEIIARLERIEQALAKQQQGVR